MSNQTVAKSLSIVTIRRLMMATCLLILFLWGAGKLALPAQAQGPGDPPQVQEVYPVENSLSVTHTSPVSLTYDAELDTGSVTTRSLTLRGEQTGIYTGTYTFPATDTVLIDPAANFRAGEVVRVTASSLISSSGGVVATPYHWQFTTTSQDGPGSGAAWYGQTLVNSGFGGANNISAADIDGDGDLDILGAAEYADDVAWWENVTVAGGSPAFTKYTIDNNFDGVRSVSAVDLDGDGDLDILGAAWIDDEITWWENDGGQSFTTHVITDTFDGANAVVAGDIDGDGDLDLLGAARDADDVVWWENDGSQNFSAHMVNDNFDQAWFVSLADVNGDGYLDLLGAAQSAGDVTWWENDGAAGGQPNFTEHTIAGNFNGASSVMAADINGDGHLDIVGAAAWVDQVAWWENDGSSNFSQQTITTNYDGAQTSSAADLDGDGDLDILSVALFDDDVTWWENATGDGSTFTEHTIDGDYNEARWISAADVDGDGDLDVLTASRADGLLTIWYNANPEIAVLGNGIEISDGDTTADSADNTDFGAWTVDIPLTHTFTISSQGVLNTDGLALNGSPAITLAVGTHFSVTQPASTTVPGSKSTTFYIIFAPQSSGTFTDTVTITSNDPDENPYTFVVAGIGRPYVEAVYPLEYSLNVTYTSPVSLTINTTLNSGSVTTASVTIRGEQTGIYAGSYSFPTADTVLIDPATDFKPGEVIRVTASSQVLSSDGIGITPYQWRFRATSQDGPGSGEAWYPVTVNDTDVITGTSAAVAADVDRDGDLDVVGAAASVFAWWENDGSQNLIEHVIDNDYNGSKIHPSPRPMWMGMATWMSSARLVTTMRSPGGRMTVAEISPSIRLTTILRVQYLSQPPIWTAMAIWMSSARPS